MTIAIHLAAGRGTRLRPITDDRPKPLVELEGQSLLKRNIKTLQSVGIDHQIIVTGYKSEKVDFDEHEIIHNANYENTEMVDSLFCAKHIFTGDEDVIITYGDIIYTEQIATNIMECTAPVCVAVDRDWKSLWELRFEDPIEDAESLKLNDNNQITSIGQEPNSINEIEAQFIGLVKVNSTHAPEFHRTYESLNTEKDMDMTTYLQYLVDLDWNIMGVETHGGWVEVDTIEDLEAYNTIIKKNLENNHLSWI